MSYYQYEAISKSGETVTGRLEADADFKVVERLRGMGLMATEIKEVKQSSLNTLFKFTPRVKLKISVLQPPAGGHAELRDPDPRPRHLEPADHKRHHGPGFNRSGAQRGKRVSFSEALKHTRPFSIALHQHGQRRRGRRQPGGDPDPPGCSCRKKRAAR